MNLNPILVLISANTEWRAIKGMFPQAEIQLSPFGEWFTHAANVYFQGGVGKISAAASAQYAIDRFQPRLLVNLGTCGGFRGEIAIGEIILAEKTIVYDIHEQMSDPEAAIARYITEIDLSWLARPLPLVVRQTLLVSADGDLRAEDIPRLKAKYGAVAGDWESGAIAWVARRNGVRCLILRGVTDLVGEGGDADSEACDEGLHAFHQNAAMVMKRLVEGLEGWLEGL